MRTTALLLASAVLAACGGADRVDLEPRSLRFAGRGQSARLQATPREGNGRPAPGSTCQWSSADPKVATVAADRNAATVHSVGPGSTSIRCAIGSVVAEAPVTVRVVARLEVRPERVELTLRDEAAAAPLEVRAFDDQGAPVLGRVVNVTCAREEVCRGDGRGQLWPAGAGETTARVSVDDALATVAVKVVDARTADGKPRAVKGDPMAEIEKAVRAREAAERSGR